MFIEMKKVLVQEGFSGELIESFHSKVAMLADKPGYVGYEILKKKVRSGDEEVLVLVRWESEQDWKNWEKHPDHIAAHKAKIAASNGKRPEPPAYVLHRELIKYDVME